MSAALQIHNAAFREVMEKYNGYEVKTEGDSFMIAFKRTTNAVRFCVEVQEQLMNEPWPPELLAIDNCKEVQDPTTGECNSRALLNNKAPNYLGV